MITLENDDLKVSIKEAGAELTSIIDKKTGYEYLWQGDANFWGRQAPVLFPIVGKLKDNTYSYKGQSYHLTQHGFARDKIFTTQNVTANSVSLYLKSDEETLAVYPFQFSLQINYILHYSSVTVSYEILNPSKEEPMYYSIGGHPAFNVSHTRLNRQAEFHDVSFTFEPAGHYLKLPLYRHGLIGYDKAKFTEVDDVSINHTSFKNDALIYAINRQTEIILKDKVEQVEIRVKPNRMDFVGIWSPYPDRAPFVCIEPWAGVADLMEQSGDITEKYGIQELLPNQLMTHDYTLSFSKGKV